MAMTNSDKLHLEPTPMGWTAYYDPEGLHGDGATRQGALEDLLDQTDEAWRKALDERQATKARADELIASLANELAEKSQVISEAVNERDGLMLQAKGRFLPMDGYDNLLAIVEGRVSGSITEWPSIRLELMSFMDSMTAKLAKSTAYAGDLAALATSVCNDLIWERSDKAMLACAVCDFKWEPGFPEFHHQDCSVAKLRAALSIQSTKEPNNEHAVDGAGNSCDRQNAVQEPEAPHEGHSGVEHRGHTAAVGRGSNGEPAAADAEHPRDDSQGARQALNGVGNAPCQWERDCDNQPWCRINGTCMKRESGNSQGSSR